jgi:hypothetical protein
VGCIENKINLDAHKLERYEDFICYIPNTLNYMLSLSNI